MAARIKKGDNIKVLSGKDKGKEGKVLRVYPKDELLLVEGINLKKRHRRPKKAGEKGSIVQMPAPLPLSKVMVRCPNCQKAARARIKIIDNGEKRRSCRKCEVEF